MDLNALRDTRRLPKSPHSMESIVLASTSPYRRELLSRLQLPFLVAAPHVEESPLAGEAPRDTALRLALAKAQAVAVRAPSSIVIGSDQVAAFDGLALSKPGSRDRAFDQLNRMQGRQVVFHTALAVVRHLDQTQQVDCIDTIVVFRSLQRAQIDAYIDADQPFDVAGAAKIESLGIALIESAQCHDPTALIGLPLIRLVTMLAALGVAIPPVR